MKISKLCSLDRNAQLVGHYAVTAADLYGKDGMFRVDDWLQVVRTEFEMRQFMSKAWAVDVLRKSPFVQHASGEWWQLRRWNRA